MGPPSDDAGKPGSLLPGGTSSTVRLVDGPDGPAVLKRYRSHRAWRQAHDALVGWRDAAGEDLRIPRVLDADAGPLSLLIEHLPGAHPGDSWREDWELARRLGRGLAALHGVPVEDRDPVPLAEACARRMEGWLSRARGVINPSIVQRVAARFRPEALAGRTRRPCHRDVEPANLLLANDAPLGLIDFEHARLDDPLVDIARTWDGRPLAQSPFTAALIAAWGRPAPEAALRVHGLLHGVATLCTAERAGDAARAAQSRDLLTWIIETPDPA